MLPLAIILQGLGHRVAGSDRSRDQGRLPEKFAWIEGQGIALFPQDGSGLSDDVDALVISTAVEDSIPDVAAAKARNIPIRKRADLLAENFNTAKIRIAIAGTSGKTTTTGMVGFLLKEAGFDPIVMNGGIFRNYAHDNPYATALVGDGDVFVTEADESDGSIALYDPDIAVVHNITLDHKPLDELKQLFGGFLAKAETAIVNLRDGHVSEILEGRTRPVLSYGLESGTDVYASVIVPAANGIAASVHYKGAMATLNLQLPGEHNLLNALAAFSVGLALNIPLPLIAEILSRFEGIKRRMEVVGQKGGVTVIDDFAHNPDKIAATLSALKKFPGRLQVFFQPHGYGFLKLTHKELAQTFAENLTQEDHLYLIEPLYLGGTVDRSYGSSHLAEELKAANVSVETSGSREEAGQAILKNATSGDRIIIMGARDDTLSDFARGIYKSLIIR